MLGLDGVEIEEDERLMYAAGCIVFDLGGRPVWILGILKRYQ